MEKNVEIRKGKIITMNELFRRKERFHKKLSQISFEDKIKILMQLWKIAANRRQSPTKKKTFPKILDDFYVTY